MEINAIVGNSDGSSSQEITMQIPIQDQGREEEEEEKEEENKQGQNESQQQLITEIQKEQSDSIFYLGTNTLIKCLFTIKFGWIATLKYRQSPIYQINYDLICQNYQQSLSHPQDFLMKFDILVYLKVQGQQQNER
ncbi:hypothetical protein ABPG73_017228 [Tetrahymena malaccensis]